MAEMIFKTIVGERECAVPEQFWTVEISDLHEEHGLFETIEEARAYAYEVCPRGEGRVHLYAGGYTRGPLTEEERAENEKRRFLAANPGYDKIRVVREPG
jgi:hypothetical protein